MTGLYTVLIFFLETNIFGTHNLLKLSLEYGVDKFLQVSTDEVYGSLGPEGFFTEETQISPNSPYSASKAAADCLVRSYNETFGLHTIITRCSNNYGKFQHEEKLIPKCIVNVNSNLAVPVYGDGKNIRDWIYVEDHCRGIFVALNESSSGEVYNFGGNCEIKNIDLVKTIIDKLNKSHDLISFVEDRLGHDFRYAIDYTKANRELG